jgi:hypothetical protein
MTDATQTTGPITIDDVRAAIGDTDPNQTNANKLRATLGRGSFATIQRHLDTIRTERAPAPVVAPGAAPAAPPDAVASLWAVAYSAAQALTLGRLEAVSAERDALAALANTQAGDLAALLATVDEHGEKIVEVEKQYAELAADMNEQMEAEDEADKARAYEDTMADSQRLQLLSELAKVQADAAHAHELAQRDASIAASAMQSTIDRLTDQVSELKSLLHKQVTSP